MRAEIAALYIPDLTAPGEKGDVARAEAGRRIGAIGNAENESYGIELGYAYTDSPIVCTEPGTEIPSDPLRYVPTTVPGVRMPNVVMSDGTPIFDRLGPWFTLACFGVQPSEALIAAAARHALAAARVTRRRARSRQGLRPPASAGATGPARCLAWLRMRQPRRRQRHYRPRAGLGGYQQNVVAPRT